jgi:hypothetical protein
MLILGLDFKQRPYWVQGLKMQAYGMAAMSCRAGALPDRRIDSFLTAWQVLLAHNISSCATTS